VTPHAPIPAESEDTLQLLKNWIGYGVTETAQKNKEANDKKVASEILDTCENDNEKAIKDAEKRNRPWWDLF
jgi:hypothetical protein